MSFQILQRAYAPYGTAAQFPASGDSRLIYRATDTGYLYTWDASESAYKLAGIDPTTAPYLGLHAQADDSAKLGGQLPSYYETAIGNPSANGYLLSSTTAGVRSWVAPYSHPATHAQSVIDSSTGWITNALAGKQAAGNYAGSATAGGAAQSLASEYQQTFTPNVTFSTTNPSGLTLSDLSGSCTAIGKLAQVRVSFVITSKGTGGAGALIVTGLPKQAKYLPSYGIYIAPCYYNGVQTYCGIVDANTIYIGKMFPDVVNGDYVQLNVGYETV